ncbi:zinc-dependent alcohol dehydrogenase family protein [Conexibacter stalactiti]|uniref:alcohol dehydrogenase n=2 Tax=Conexibacter stalactiti TaxID=1940611 RepID=A0ABU4HLE2_9ACTN|nr:zinc-dependent alcohol dehydrogenase family protein [Conexibacter stalactiti]MDW5593534.1 zinc-dependent alcohol dehydrogenase family protein [Conexibacter stalactiti]MEC5034175.1 zinc-dependent alcohol dehydrogenase family protein [Conexibacter stalactiti]
MVLDSPGRPLRAAELPDPRPGAGDLLLRVRACGVCRTDLHLRDDELDAGHLPLVLGHQIVGEVVAAGAEVAGARRAQIGSRVGVPWLGWTCGRCRYCTSGRENLCAQARFTGCDRDGGYAELTVADARFCFPLPDAAAVTDVQLAPLLCAGLIGYRALRMAGDAERLGLYGFGAAAHLICQVAVHEGREVFAFTREDDRVGQRFARELGAVWAGGSAERPPEELDAALIFAPVGALVPLALRAVARGGTVVCAGIHMSDIPSFPYVDLWGERTLRSVANLTRNDGEEFLALAPHVPLRTAVTTYPLEAAEQALADLRAGAFEGAAVLEIA